jgi:O-antigen/teichoic acid export membrane protein
MWTFESSGNLTTWAFLYLASNLGGAVLAILMLTADFGRPRWVLYPGEMRRSLQYGFETVSISTFRELDKPIVFSILGPEIGGLYAAAYRIVDTACFPITALLRTVYARFFVHGRSGSGAGLRLALITLALGAAMSIIIGTALFSLAWLVPLLLGAQFYGVIPIIKAMAILPALAMFSGVGGDFLRSVDLLRERFFVWLIATISFVPVCYLGILAGAAIGAALARGVIQLILGLLLWATIAARRKLVFSAA